MTSLSITILLVVCLGETVWCHVITTGTISLDLRLDLLHLAKYNETVCCGRPRTDRLQCPHTDVFHFCERVLSSNYDFKPGETYLFLASSTIISFGCNAAIADRETIVFNLLSRRGKSLILDKVGNYDGVQAIVIDNVVGNGSSKVHKLTAELNIPVTQALMGQSLTCCVDSFYPDNKLCDVSPVMLVYCSKPLVKRRLSLDSLLDPSRLTFGKKVHVYCTDFLEGDASLKFVVAYKRNGETWENVTYSEYAPEVQMIKDTRGQYIDGCRYEIATARFTLLLQQHMSELIVSCCDDETRLRAIKCAKTPRFKLECPVQDEPSLRLPRHESASRPDLVEGEQLEAECSMEVNSWSWLEFRLRDNVTRTHTVYTREDTAVKVLENITAKVDCPVTKVRAQLTLDLHTDMSGHRLTCCRTSKRRRDEACTASLTLNVRCPEKGPSDFDTEFVKDSNVLFAGRTLYTECKSYLDNDREFSFKRTHNTLKKGRQERIYTVDDKEVTIVKAEGPKSNKCKLTTLVASLNLSITEQLNEEKLSCCVLDTSHGDPCLVSPSIAVEYPPYRPVLNVVYHDDSGAVFSGKPLSASCTAGVGTNGSLSWVLFGQNVTRVWTIDFSGKLLDDLPKGVEITHSPALIKKGENPVLSSTLTIVVTEALQGAKLACYSYNVTDRNVSADLADSYRRISLALHVTYSLENVSEASGGAFLGALATILAAFAVLLAAFFVVIIVMTGTTNDIDINSGKGQSYSTRESGTGTSVSQSEAPSEVATEDASTSMTSGTTTTTATETSFTSATSAVDSPRP